MCCLLEQKGWLYFLASWWSYIHVDFPSEKKRSFYCRCGKQRAILNSTCLVCAGLINLFHKCENNWPFFTLAKPVQLACIKRDEFCSQSHMCNEFILIPLHSMRVIPNLCLWESCILPMKYFWQNDSKSFVSLDKFYSIPLKQMNAVHIKHIYISAACSCVNWGRKAQFLMMS